MVAKRSETDRPRLESSRSNRLRASRFACSTPLSFRTAFAHLECGATGKTEFPSEARHRVR
ncbi:hypothetical protein C496_21025 [Natronorubrum tibetense GA33]|uniref:Uncharacterized protein n=1 Tax=Natronorubrum tibetense GA33 TaxID=1114856 RepID=L9VHQ5_9EURY|nr:hypothetical protein C496_21025 [Natronorubrum tibetense GA33]